MKRYLRNYASLLSLASLVIVLDQGTKALVRATLIFGESWAPWDWLIPHARIIHWQNTGAAFGMLHHWSTLFTILPFFVIAAILYYLPRVPSKDRYLRIALGLILGGAAGNLIDRLTIGHVTDFISVGALPVINLADASISIGTAIWIAGMWIQERANAARDPDLPAAMEEIQGD